MRRWDGVIVTLLLFTAIVTPFEARPLLLNLWAVP